VPYVGRQGGRRSEKEEYRRRDGKTRRGRRGVVKLKKNGWVERIREGKSG